MNWHSLVRCSRDLQVLKKLDARAFAVKTDDLLLRKRKVRGERTANPIPSWQREPYPSRADAANIHNFTCPRNEPPESDYSRLRKPAGRIPLYCLFQSPSEVSDVLREPTGLPEERAGSFNPLPRFLTC